MHLESLLIHINQEIIASEHYDVMVSDRSAVDYLAYANLRYSPESQNHFLKSVRALTREYSALYDRIFVTPDFRGIDPGDPLRRGENVASPDVSNEIVRLCVS